MKNESGVNEDITMLDALQRLWHHKAKRKSIRFEITFDDVSRKVVLARSGAGYPMTGTTMSRTDRTHPSMSMERNKWFLPLCPSPG